MTYRVYLRWPGQKVSDKTETPSREVADLAFKTLVGRTDLAGQDVAVTFTENGQNLAYHDFRKVEPPENRGNR